MKIILSIFVGIICIVVGLLFAVGFIKKMVFGLLLAGIGIVSGCLLFKKVRRNENKSVQGS